MEKENKQRLINVNAVIRKIQKAHKKIIEKYGSADGADIVIEVIVEFLKKAPSVDAVEVVRCKDCKRCKSCYPEKQIGKEATPGWYCKEHKSYRRPDDFCSYGERREGE